MPDTPFNQKQWPQPRSQKEGCGFPLLKWVGLFCLVSGTLLAMATGGLLSHDIPLFQQLWESLSRGDLLVADRGFSSYAMYAMLQKRGVEAVFRYKGNYPAPAKGSRLKKIRDLGHNDHLVEWKKPYQKAAWISQEDWDALPRELILRFVIFKAQIRGFRDQEFVVVTTLLDAKEYPAQEIAQLYGLRWQVEGFIGQLKTTLKMAVLRCKSPGMVEKEIVMNRIAFNLLQGLRLQSALRHGLEVGRISFTGTLNMLQAQASAGNCGSTQLEKAKKYEQLLQTIARCKIPKRAGRRNPRALKRRPKPFPLLNKPRHHFKEIPHRSSYKK